MHHPEPARGSMQREQAADRNGVECVSPGEPLAVEAQSGAQRVIDEPLAEFTVRENQPRRVERRELSGDDIVRQRSTAQENLDVRSVGELAEHLLGA